MEINKMWNEYLHENSKVIKFLEQDKSFLLSELRNYKEYFYFPREYVQMRHSFKTSDNEIYIIEKSIDNEEMCY